MATPSSRTGPQRHLLLIAVLIVLQTDITVEKKRGGGQAPIQEDAGALPLKGDYPGGPGDVVIDTLNGKIRGETYVLDDGSRGVRFLGIPYALPPVGERRFKDPEPMVAWSGIRDATRFGPICFQPLESDVWDMVASEDSLEDFPVENQERMKEKLRNRIHQVEELVNEMKMSKEHFGNSSKYLKNSLFEIYGEDLFRHPSFGSATQGQDLPMSDPAGEPMTFTTFTSAATEGGEKIESEVTNLTLLEMLHPRQKSTGHSSQLLPVVPEVPVAENGTSTNPPSFVSPPSTPEHLRQHLKTKKHIFMKHKLLSDYKMSEDCLTLNVYTPLISAENPPKELFPVIVYVHGGSFYSNGGRLYPGERLATEGVVVVTLNYRLGPFGFLSTGDSVARGNWGLQDQRLALVWLQRHLPVFGGDKNKVLLVGNSAGGSSVILQMLSPLSKGLFTRVAAMSGCSLAPWSIQSNPLRATKKLASGLNCPTDSTESIVTCLRKASADSLNEEFTFNTVQDGLWLSFAPVVENSPGAFLPRPPRQLLTEGTFPKMPLILTLTRDEVTIWFRNHPETMQKTALETWMNKIIRQIYFDLDSAALGPVSHVIRGFYIYSRGYTPSNTSSSLDEGGDIGVDPQQQEVPVDMMADLFSDVGLKVPCMEEAKLLSEWTPTYLAEFTYASDDDVRVGNQQWIGSYHESDLQYMLGQPFLGIRNSLRLQEDKQVASLTMGIMKSFAERGVPELVGANFTWPCYNISSKLHVEISDQPTIGRGLLQKKLYFWLDFVPLLVKWPYEVLPSIAITMNASSIVFYVTIATVVLITLSICTM